MNMVNSLTYIMACFYMIVAICDIRRIKREYKLRPYFSNKLALCASWILLVVCVTLIIVCVVEV